MIDPLRVTDFNRGDFDLQSFFLFCFAVAGKNAKVQAEKLNNMIDGFQESWVENPIYHEEGHPIPDGPLTHMMDMNSEVFFSGATPLENALRHEKMGKYQSWIKMVNWFNENLHPHMVDGFLRRATLETLLLIPGVGDKTARFFILHSREDEQCIPLDTHVLKFISSKGVPCVPTVTPSKSKYRMWEKIAREMYTCEMRVKGYRNMAETDLAIWKSFSSFSKNERQHDSNQIEV